MIVVQRSGSPSSLSTPFLLLLHQLDLFLPRNSSLSLGFLLVSVAICGAADGAAQGALFGEAASSQPSARYTQALVAGTAVSGVVVSFLRILTKALLTETPDGLRISADIYFIVAAAFCALCAFFYASTLPTLRLMNDQLQPELVEINNEVGVTRQAREEGSQAKIFIGLELEDSKRASEGTNGYLNEEEVALTGQRGSQGVSTSNDSYISARGSYWSVARCVRVPAACLTLTYSITLAIFPGVLAEDMKSSSFGSWYPVVLIAVFNVADCLGKFLPGIRCCQMHSQTTLMVGAALRILFLPAFYLVASQAAGPGVVGVLATFLGVTNGYLTANAFMMAPPLVPSTAANVCGNIMVYSLIVGLCIGAVCGFLWLL